MSNENDTVTDLFGLLDHGGDLIFIKNIDHVIFSLTCTGIVGSVGVVQKCDLNAINLFYFNSICIFRSVMDAQNRNIRIIGAPEIKGIFQIIITVIIHMVGSGFHYIETSFDNGISHFLRCGERGVSADRIMIRGKNSLLINHSHICGLDLIQHMGVNMVVIPCAGIVFSGFIQLAVVKIIAHCDDTGSGNLRSFSRCFSFLLFLRGSLFCFSFRFRDQAVIQLVKTEKKKQ